MRPGSDTLTVSASPKKARPFAPSPSGRCRRPAPEGRLDAQSVGVADAGADPHPPDLTEPAVRYVEPTLVEGDAVGERAIREPDRLRELAGRDRYTPLPTVLGSAEVEVGDVDVIALIHGDPEQHAVRGEVHARDGPFRAVRRDLPDLADVGMSVVAVCSPSRQRDVEVAVAVGGHALGERTPLARRERGDRARRRCRRRGPGWPRRPAASSASASAARMRTVTKRFMSPPSRAMRSRSMPAGGVVSGRHTKGVKSRATAGRGVRAGRARGRSRPRRCASSRRACGRCG